jgi:hypothetical protein
MSIDSVVLNEEQQLELSRIAPVPIPACRICIPCEADFDAGRRSVVQHDEAAIGNYGADHYPLEAALRFCGAGRTRY